MSGRVRIPIVLLVWLVIGVLVAVNKDYAETMDNASQVATFVLAVVLWPIPALDGQVGIVF
jgi:ABC-type Na+ efflux pump permease subunit